jgi:hypothetical protein
MWRECPPSGIGHAPLMPLLRVPRAGRCPHKFPVNSGCIPEATSSVQGMEGMEGMGELRSFEGSAGV